jgi:hypothetical protein
MICRPALYGLPPICPHFLTICPLWPCPVLHRLSLDLLGSGAASATIVISPPLPDFAGEGGAPTERRGMNHRQSRLRAHRIGFTLEAQNGCHPLAQSLRPLNRRIELPRDPADACLPQDNTRLDVARAARPNQILGRSVALVTVKVMRLDTASASAEGAHQRVGRAAVGMGGAIAGSAIRDGRGRLSPALTTPAAPLYSSPASSSPTTPTTSAISSK